MADNKVKFELELDLDNKSVKAVFADVEREAKIAGEKSGEAFDSGFGDKVEGGAKALGNFKNAFLAVGAVAAGTVLAIRNVAQAAARQQDAVNKLNTALRLSGEFSESTSEDLQEFASSLQAITRFGDEAIIEQLALAKSFGASAEQSKRVVSAATDLAAAFGTDLESATRNVAKTLGGYAGELGEVIPELKALTTAQLQAGDGIDLIAEKFRGFAAEDVKTFSGAIEQLGNIFGDVEEAFGRFIIESSAVNKALRFLAEAFQGVIAAADDFAVSISQETTSEIKKRINQIKVEVIDLEQQNIAISRSLEKLRGRDRAALQGDINRRNAAIKELEGELSLLEKRLGANERKERELEEARKKQTITVKTLTAEEKRRNERLAKAVVTLGQTQVQAIQATQTQQVGLIREAVRAGVITAKEGDKKITEINNQTSAKLKQNIQGIGQTQEQVIRETLAVQTAALEEAAANGVITQEEFIQRLEILNETAQQKILKANEANVEEQSVTLGTLFEQLAAGFAATENDIKRKAVGVSKAAIFLGQNIKRGIGEGVGDGFAAFGAALVSGENALDAFAKAFLGTLGQMMIQQGTAFILQGLGFSVIPGLQGNGAALITTGAALAAFGGALTAFAGSTGTATASAGGSEAVGIGTSEVPDLGDETLDETTDEELAEAGPRIEVNIQGDVLDSDETALRIIDLINDAFDQQGAVVTGGTV